MFSGEFVKALDRRIQQRARERLKYLDSAIDLRDLMIPPSNQLEALKGDRPGQHSILKLSSYKVAKELGVAAPTVNEIVRRRRAITAEMALRLSRYFGTSAQLWQNLQTQYDLEIASKRIGKKVERAIQPLTRPDLR